MKRQIGLSISASEKLTVVFAHSSILFVPGSRPDRFAKAREAGAGVTVIDLEDAVAEAAKADARSFALGEAGRSAARLAIRLNALSTASGLADLIALEAAGALPEYLFLPMVEHAREVQIVTQVLGQRCPALVPLIETPRGLRGALGIARSPNVAAVMFGGGDFAGELGVSMSWEPLLAARQQLLLACAEARVPAIDVPWIALDDAAGLEQECRRVRALGFAAKAAIHPRQIPVIETAFAPAAAEVAEAQAALEAYEHAGGQVIRFRGRMLEAPIVKHYRAVLARSRGQGNA